ncbi:amidase [Periconia macrospinosa]|uniref:amidase n=1 Tax=Periconia macrospinosa TaxID=97972 RepID=A0A2V1DWU2_9PLEO|nr:amidase [Periconia macrospinosa]
MATRDWKQRAQEKREAILAAIPTEWRISNPPSVEDQLDVTGPYIHQFLSPQEIEITETTADGIVANTSTGAWKAEDVARAFCHRAALAHQLLHCLHEIFFDAAIADARALDAYFAEHKKPVGPLHGLPVSLKDQFHVKGVETTMGYVGWIGTFEGKTGTGKEKVFESELVKLLRKAGAVLYVKTSVPHTLMMGETTNNIIGYTLNPKNRRLTSGGSSGGEGALLGIKGSPLGFGTDIGGSIRIPSAFNGLYGIRPSTGRLPYQGMANSMDGQNSILSVVGPLSTSAAGLRLAVESLLSFSPWLVDPLVIEKPFSTPTYTSARTNSHHPLTFAVMETDGIVNPVAPIRRGVRAVVSALEKQGHKVIPWQPPSHAELQHLALEVWTMDGGTDVQAAFALSGETTSPQVSYLLSLSGDDGEKRASHIAGVNVALREYRKRYLDYWVGTREVTGTGRPVDAVICPLAPTPSARREMFKYVGYSVWVNALDLTSVVLPVAPGVDRERKEDAEEGYVPLSQLDKEVHDSYDPDFFHGAHCSVQLVGRRLQEETMLGILEYVSEIMKS